MLELEVISGYSVGLEPRQTTGMGYVVVIIACFNVLLDVKMSTGLAEWDRSQISTAHFSAAANERTDHPFTTTLSFARLTHFREQPAPIQLLLYIVTA